MQKTFLISKLSKNINLRTYDFRTYRKIPTGQGDDYTTGCLLDYNYFKDHFKMIAIDFIKKHLI